MFSISRWCLALTLFVLTSSFLESSVTIMVLFVLVAMSSLHIVTIVAICRHVTQKGLYTKKGNGSAFLRALPVAQKMFLSALPSWYRGLFIGSTKPLVNDCLLIGVSLTYLWICYSQGLLS